MLLRIDGPLNFFWQWDLNRRILIEDQTCTQVHFTNGATQQALVLEIQRDDTGRYANVPNILLQQAKPITALLYLQNGESMTLHAQTFRILPRPRPDNYVYTETEVLTWVALDARIKALEESGGVSPEKVAEMVADYLDKNPPVESDPTVPAWAKQPVKPGYTAAEVGADPQGAASTAVSEHNVAADAHNDIRLQIGYLSQLQTTDKSSLVAAINELYATGGGSGDSGGTAALLASLKTILANIMTIIKAQVEDDSGTPQAYNSNVSGLFADNDLLIDALGADAYVVGISATYTGGDVPVGTALTALSGIVVTAAYSDGTSKPITGYSMSGVIAEGDNVITISYSGYSTGITVTGVVVENPDSGVTQTGTLLAITSGVTVSQNNSTLSIT